MSYVKGRRFEWQVRSMLESRRWIVIRAARSKPVDLIAVKNGSILMIECKYDSWISEAEKSRLCILAEEAGAKPVLAVKRRYEREIKLIDLSTGEEVEL